MDNKSFELILHPVRMRIIQAFLAGKKRTALQLVELMADVPQATLYRHLKKLHQAGVLIVIEENQVRGTLEKVYALSEDKVIMTPEDAKNLKPEDHQRYFTTFVTMLLKDFQNYIKQGEIDVFKDGLSYRKASLYLSDEEFKELMTTVAKGVQKHLENKPSPERRLRSLTTIVIPE